MATRVQIRRGTAAEWSSADPILASGEFGYETDTGVLKIGDGSTAYSALDPLGGPGGGSGGYTYVQIESIDGPPTSPAVGDTWFDPENGNTYLRYNDGVTTQWIQSGTVSTGGTGGGVSLEQVRDDLVTTLVPGTNITITHDDEDDTITIDATPAGGSSISPYWVIAASNAPAAIKAQANVICDGTADQVEIQAALDLGYPVLLTQGLFNTASQINMPSLGVLRGMGFKTTIRPAVGVAATGDGATIGSKNNSAALWTIEDLVIDGAYQGVHGIRIYNTSMDAVDPPANGSDNYGTIRHVFIEGCKGGGTTRGIWLDDNPDGLRTCQVMDVNMRACDTALEINSSDHIISNVCCGADTINGLVITGNNSRITNAKFWFTQAFGVNDTGGRNVYSGIEVQDAIGIAYRFYGHETFVSSAFANIVSASRATTTAFDIWCEGSSFVGLGVQFSTGSSRTMDYAFDFNTSNNITVIGTIGNPETDFDNTDITGSEGTGSHIRIARVGAPAYEGVTAATVTGTTDTLALADHAKQISYTNAALVTVTLANVYTGFETVLKSLGAAGLTIATGGMSYANGFTPKKTIAQGESLHVRQTAASTFEITGGSSA